MISPLRWKVPSGCREGKPPLGKSHRANGGDFSGPQSQIIGVGELGHCIVGLKTRFRGGGFPSMREISNALDHPLAYAGAGIFVGAEGRTPRQRIVVELE